MMRRAKFFILSVVFVFSLIGCSRTANEKHGWALVPGIVQRIQTPAIPELEISVLSFGAKADGVTDNAAAIRSAIRACTDQHGGKIIFPPGEYYIGGPIHLENNIQLHLTENARLIFGDDPKSYLPVVLTSWEGTRLYNYSPFIYAMGKSNIAITGSGVIDGTASHVFNNWRPNQVPDQTLLRHMNNADTPLSERIFGDGHFLRPHLIQFYACENVLIDGVTILDAPFWCVHMVFSQNITIRNVTFNSQQLNNDGIDIESSEYVLIENIRFNNNDDNIAIKAGRDLEGRKLQKPSRNIIVRNCSFQGHNALAIGSEMSGGVYNVFVENCTSEGDVRNGIYLKSNKDRGGKIADTYMRNISFVNVNTLIRIEPDYKGEGALHPPVFENIFLENISTQNAAEYGIYIMGSAESPVRNVMLKDIRINRASTSALIKYATGVNMSNVQIN
jgi:polygalacturonase